MMPTALPDLIERERTELMQIHAMIRCLGGVLEHADDDDASMHADVATAIARLLNESITRLEVIRMRVTQLVAVNTAPPNNQLREPRSIYFVETVRSSTTRTPSPPDSERYGVGARWSPRNLDEQRAIA